MTGIRWVPMESNPTAMTEWAAKAGLATSTYSFRDVYGFDEDLLSFVPQPVRAIVLLFPFGELQPKRLEEDAVIQQEGQHPVDPDVIWIEQTIANACGSMGLLHALLNSDVPIGHGSWLASLKKDCKSKDGIARTQLLEASDFLANIHDAAARSGQTTIPPNLDTTSHYTTFVEAIDPQDPSAKRVIELDGHRFGPVDRGVCVDLLRDAVRIIQEKYVSLTANPGFAVVALVPAADVTA